MGIIELLLLAVGLSMDAFAVSVCKGLSERKLKLRHYIIVGDRTEDRKRVRNEI